MIAPLARFKSTSDSNVNATNKMSASIAGYPNSRTTKCDGALLQQCSDVPLQIGASRSSRAWRGKA